LQRLLKEELYENAMISAKQFLKFCQKQGFMLRKVEYELFIAKVHLRCGAYHEALFQTLKVIDKTEEWQMNLVHKQGKLLLAEILLEMGDYYEALLAVNELDVDGPLKAEICNLKAKIVLFLSKEIKYNEVGAVLMQKAAISTLTEMVRSNYTTLTLLFSENQVKSVHSSI
jgi:tetratricopeptide (TPR) repeat protein